MLLLKFPGFPCNEDSAIEIFQQRGILPVECKCRQYGHSMRLYKKDRFYWRDSHSTCDKKIPIREGTWFSGTLLPFHMALRFICGWAYELTSIEWCKRALNIGKTLAVKMNRNLREICMEAMKEERSKKIGGNNKIVEIAESHFTNHKKNGRRQLHELWVFGGFCAETDECFIVQVPDRNAKTLLEIIHRNVKSGSIIFSECFRRYKLLELEEVGFTDFKIKHSYTVIDSEARQLGDRTEKLWDFVKKRNHIQRGTVRQYFESYLIEFLWRNRIGCSDPFDAILTSIKNHSPPQMEF